MVRLVLIAFLISISARAQSIGSSYSTRDGRAGTVVMSCPSQDGSYTALSCNLGKPAVVTYAGPASSAIVTANVAVTVFAAGTVSTGCDVVNTGTAVVYLDFVATALAGSATSIPLQANQSFHCPYPPTGAVTAIAAQPQPFVAVRY